MALVVESTSTNSSANAASVTVTKPSGVATGDLLVIVASKYASPAITCSGFTEAFNVSRNVGNLTDFYLTILWRIADASDVAAANYSVQMAANDDGGIAAMFRISGWSGGTPSFIFSDSDSSLYTNATTPATLGMSGIEIVRPSDGVLIMAHTINVGNTAPGISMASYTVTSADSNPSWTELVDASVNVNANTADNYLSVAYAPFTANSIITAYAATLTESTTVDFGWGSFLVALCEPAAATGTNALLQVSPAIFANSGMADATGTNALLEVEPEIFTQNGTTTTPTVWQNEAQATTEWINEQL